MYLNILSHISVKQLRRLNFSLLEIKFESAKLFGNFHAISEKVIYVHIVKTCFHMQERASVLSEKLCIVEYTYDFYNTIFNFFVLTCT